MKMMVAQRTLDGCFGKEDWWPNPEWICAPFELIQTFDDDPCIDADGFACRPNPPRTGPFRFKAQDREKAEQYAREQNWDELGKLAVPERIPPQT